MGPEDSSGDNGLQDVKKLFTAAADSDHQRRRTIRQSMAGPFREFCEIEEICRLDLVFGGILLLPQRQMLEGQEGKTNPQSRPEPWPAMH